MPQEIGAIARDALALVFLFVLRIGVPVLITLLIGIWLQRVLREPETEAKTARPYGERQSHCWDWGDTAATRCARSAAASRPDLPCWLAVQVSGQGLTEECYTCPLFSPRMPAPSPSPFYES